MSGRHRATPWRAALILGAAIVLSACSASHSPRPREDRCRSWSPPQNYADCIAHCMECGARDYGPCSAACQTAGQPGITAGWSPTQPGAAGQYPGAAAPQAQSSLTHGSDDEDDLALDERPAAVGALEIDLTRLLAAQSTAGALPLIVDTYREQVRSEAVARRAAQRLGLSQRPGYARTEEEAVDRVHGAVRARRRGTSAVIEVRIVDTIDPALAAQICDAIMEAQIERTREIALEDRRRRGESTDPATLPSDARVLDRCRPLRPHPSWGFGF